jgi:hypothetical protein
MTGGVHPKSSSPETTWEVALSSTVLFGMSWYALIIAAGKLLGVDSEATGEIARRREAAALGDLMFVAGFVWLCNVVVIVALRPRWRYVAPAVLIVAQVFAAAAALGMMRLAAVVGIPGWAAFVWCLLATLVGVELARMISRRLAQA